MNARRYMGLTRSSRAPAYRELAELVAKGCPVPRAGKGRSSGYEIAWGGWDGGASAEDSFDGGL
jgi:hypothetical protein